MTSVRNSLERRLQELEESEGSYALALAGSDAGLWDWDLLSNQLRATERFQELLGFAPAGGGN